MGKTTTSVITEPKLHAGRMEIAVAELINWRINTIVPNISWGFGLRHEADLLVLDDKNRLTEIEIKVTASDLKNDFKKPHGHISNKISRLVYAVPENHKELALELIPKHCGLIAVKWNGFKYQAKWVRQCRHNPRIGSITDKDVRKLLELGCMRIWSLKNVVFNNKDGIS